MSEREMYLAMAAWLRQRGFTEHYMRVGKRCGCFLYAADQVMDSFDTKIPRIEQIVGADLNDPPGLRRAGWIEGCTDDAVAACLIAADLATPAP